MKRVQLKWLIFPAGFVHQLSFPLEKARFFRFKEQLCSNPDHEIKVKLISEMARMLRSYIPCPEFKGTCRCSASFEFGDCKARQKSNASSRVRAHKAWPYVLNNEFNPCLESGHMVVKRGSNILSKELQI